MSVLLSISGRTNIISNIASIFSHVSLRFSDLKLILVDMEPRAVAHVDVSGTYVRQPRVKYCDGTHCQEQPTYWAEFHSKAPLASIYWYEEGNMACWMIDDQKMF